MDISIPNYLELLGEKRGFYIKHNITKIIFNNLIDKFGVVDLSKKLKVSTRSIYYYIDGRRNPDVNLILNCITLLNKKKYLDDLYKSNLEINTWGHNSDILPLVYNEELAYLTGLICGDGHVSKRTEIYICNESKNYLKNFIFNIFKKNFNYKPKFIDLGTYARLDVSSKPIHFFFNKIIGIPSGKKKGKLIIPKFIYSSKEFKKQFLIGLFDSDGGLTLSKKAISILISSSTYDFLIEVKKLLEEFGVYLPGPYKSGNQKGFEIRSFKKSEIIKFRKNIGSKHSFKFNRMNALIAQFG